MLNFLCGIVRLEFQGELVDWDLDLLLLYLDVPLDGLV